MADQRRWYKLWHTALDDDDLLALPPEDRWRWVALGLYVSVHGNKGSIEIHSNNPALALAFSCPETDVLSVLKRLPNILVSQSEKRNDKIIVTISNWSKYQHDTTNSERQARNRYKKRGEERRGEEKRLPPKPPSKTRTPKAVEEAMEYTIEWGQQPWPSTRAFVYLYNTQAPQEWPMVETLSNGRAEKMRQYLKQFPKKEWWEKVFTKARESAFCRSYHNGGLDWLLQKGKDDQIENCAKVHDGKFL